MVEVDIQVLSYSDALTPLVDDDDPSSCAVVGEDSDPKILFSEDLVSLPHVKQAAVSLVESNSAASSIAMSAVV